VILSPPANNFITREDGERHLKGLRGSEDRERGKEENMRGQRDNNIFKAIRAYRDET
jgi:hypothetical protein